MSKIKNISKDFHAITPSLVVQGANEAIEFYKKVFGANVRRLFYSSDGKIAHAELEIADSVIMLSDEFPMLRAFSPKSPGGGTSISLYIFVDNVDDIFSKCDNAGAIVILPPADGFWGDRFASIVDPFGHRWTLATHIKNVTDEEIEKAAKEFSLEKP